MPVRKIIVSILFTLLAVSMVATPVWNDAIPIRQGVNIEWFRTGVETPDGAAIYVWSDTKLGERDLWAQKVSATGQMMWGEPLLVDGKPDRQEDPVICKTTDGNFIIAWIDFSDDLDGNVYAQKISSQGQRMWQEGGVPVCTASQIQIGLNMEPDGDGGAYVIWGDSRNPSKDLYAQRLGSNGNALWEANGIPVANGVGDEVQNTMYPDGQGGFIIAYTHTYVGNDDVFAKRFLPDATMAWPQHLIVGDGVGNQNSVRMVPMDNSEFMLIWKSSPIADDNIYANKINLQGQFLWPQTVAVIDDSAGQGAPQLNPRAGKTSDNGVIIVWEDHRLDPQNPDLFAQKLNASGTKLWAATGIVLADAPFGQYGPRLAGDNSGGAYIVWDDTRNGNAPNYDVFAQHLSSTGEGLWGADGMAICTAVNEQSGSLIKFAGGNVFINWMDIRNGSVGIYYQVLNAAGVPQLAENGQVVFWGLSGDAPLKHYQLLSRGSDAVVIWQDTRFANNGYQIYFQIVNSAGVAQLETNGRPVTASIGAEQLSPKGVILPDGSIAVVWEDKRQDNPKIFAQLLSPTGERMWGETGMELTEASPLRQMEPRISYYNDAIYIGWSGIVQTGSSYIFQVFGQKLVNGQKQWGPNGVLISDLGTVTGVAECTITDLIDSYFVWERINSVGDPRTIYVKRMAPDGTAVAGWPAEGLRTSTYSGFDAIQVQPVATLTEQGIFVAWKDLRTDFVMNYYGQLISPSGVRLWDANGLNLADNVREQELAVVDGHSSGITFVWAESINGMHDIMMSKFSFAGSPLWNPLGNYVAQLDSTQTNPDIARFANSGIAAVWADYFLGESDIHYNYINNDANIVHPGAGLVLCDVAKFQYEPQIVTVDNQAFVLWADGRSSGKTEILGLYMHKIGNECVGNNDPTTPAIAGIRNLQNYPNPFNPTTNISFELEREGVDYKLDIYNSRGQLVRSLHNGYLAAGQHRLSWDGRDENGTGVSSGVYFFRLSNSTENQTRKMVLMK